MTEKNFCPKGLLLLILTVVSLGLAAQTVTLTFTAKDAGNHYVQLNRVIITNLTKSWQETIYWPDTVMQMQNGTGIDDHTQNGGFALSQNNPNPFSGITDVTLTAVEDGPVSMEISDVNGRIVETQNFASLPTGTHQFRITLAVAGTYVLTARQNGETSSIKMICNGGGGANTIDHLGEVQTLTYVLKSSTNNPFNFGDIMEYVGYAIINGSEEESQRITQAQGTSQTFTLQFAVTSYQVPSVTTQAATNVLSNSATCGGIVNYDGGTAVTAYGVCWSTTQNPTISGSHTTDGSGTGSFTSNLTSLSPNTTYYVRAYATNAAGTAYGQQRTFTTAAMIPSVTTATASNITATTAVCGGNVTATGGANVTARGVCWSTTQNPTVNDSHTSDGNGSGNFTSSITGLSAMTTYYVRAYATNSAGTAYGQEITFTTLVGVPEVSTNVLSNITASSANCGGEVTATGGAAVTARGVCWSISPNPTVNNAHTTDGSGTGNFSSSITGLGPATTYYVRAYATNSAGTGYGEQRSFTTTGTFSCGTSAITDYDGNSYNTVLLGFQCWMAENLRTTHYADGTTIAEGNNNSWDSDDAYYYPSGNSSEFGYLYNWKAAMRNAPSSQLNPSGVQGVCPTGWHLPSDAEWNQLLYYVSSKPAYSCDNDTLRTGKALTASTGWVNHSESSLDCDICKNASDNNATGFGAQPAGIWFSNGYGYSQFGEGSFLWTSESSASAPSYAKHLRFTCGNYSGYKWADDKKAGLSVRCLRDDGTPAYTTAIDGQPCPGVLTMNDYQGNIYNTVHIGTQCWMAENLRTTVFPDGTPITEGNITNYAIAEAHYFNSPIRYNWAAVMHGASSSSANPSGVQGVCPTGWHVPSDAEWTQLTNYVSSMPGYLCNNNSYNIAKALSSTSYWYSNQPSDCVIGYNPNANNATGFSATPATLYDTLTEHGVYLYYNGAYFWSSTENTIGYVWYRSLLEDQAYVTREVADKLHGAAVRCILNETQSCGRPNISTKIIYNITTSSATCGGDVLATGGANVTARGVCWSTTPDPTINDSHTTNGSGTGSFTSNITGLTANVTYYVRAYATNSAGISYGNIRSFTAAYSPASVTTVAVSNVTTTSATCSGNVTASDGSNVTARGVCWSTSPNPTINGSHTTNGSGLGSFTGNITGLTAGTSYYVRAYATNSGGTAYGNEICFTTAGGSDGQPCPNAATVTDYDGHVYNTVQIGNQCWMKENLRTTHYSNGESISLGSTTSSTTPYYYNYTSSSIALSQRGYLYNWPAVMHGANASNTNPSGVQGICPTGWHVPSEAEWTQLTSYVGGQGQYNCNGNNTYIGKALASQTGWNSSSNTCAVGNTPSINNSTGFSAVPAGDFYSSSYYDASYNTYFWSTYYYSYSVKAFTLYFEGATLGSVLSSKYMGYSVRCIRDETGGGGSTATLPTVTTNTVSGITATSATCGGNVTATGGANVTARGVCWSTSQNPTVSNSHTTDGSGTGTFTSSITGLTANTTYYVRAYATNSAGTAYGEQRSFATTSGSSSQDGQPCSGATTVTDYDGNSYNTVQIGQQCWMKENLRTTHYSNGVSIPAGGSSSSSTNPYYYNYSSSSLPLSQRGLLYNWPAVMNGSSSSTTNPSGVQGICPTGWHVPSDAEWTQLTDYVSSQSGYVCGTNNTYIAKALSSTTGWNTSTSTCAVGNNQSANNATGFSAVPAGYGSGSSFYSVGDYADFWSSSWNSNSSAWSRYLNYNLATVSNFDGLKFSGRSVRCLLD